MRYAIISDIHANIEAMEATLQAIQSEAVDQVICLGDLVGYRANPGECIQLIRSKQIACVRGNHDAVAAGFAEPTGFGASGRRSILWTRFRISREEADFLHNLPRSIRFEPGCMAIHGSLTPDPDEHQRIDNELDAGEVFGVMAACHADVRICFFGHTHRPIAYEYREGQARTLRDQALTLQRDVCYLINPGSVGQSRDQDPRASYLVFDADGLSVVFRRVAYDYRKAWRKAQEAGLTYRPGVIGRCRDLVWDVYQAGRSLLTHSHETPGEHPGRKTAS